MRRLLASSFALLLGCAIAAPTAGSAMARTPDSLPRIVVLGDSLTSGRGIARERAASRRRDLERAAEGGQGTRREAARDARCEPARPGAAALTVIVTAAWLWYLEPHSDDPRTDPVSWTRRSTV